ncbi:flagellar protein FlaG [Shewanella sp. VB17]|uniref:flagellar protein FlaG n=1 Tax=Shewanella sp. VB17 TaxID=2739432 RepID=UPI001566BF64|nr:flagellar protein FlaG [Shewanella sp. VB17]NRD73335.1 flagellar protein FlaG [Shewanella sp. VB17]
MDINLINSSSTAAVKIEPSVGQVKATAPESTELERRATIQAVDKAEKENEAQPKASQADMQKLVDDLSDMMSVMRKGLAFQIDESGKNIVKVMDVDSGDIIRQIPNEEAIKLAQKLSEVTGLLMKTEA